MIIRTKTLLPTLAGLVMAGTVAFGSILSGSGPVSASGGDVVTNYVQNGVTYRAHLFLSPVRATFDDGQTELDAGTDEVNGVAVTDGMVVYVEHAANAEQIGKTFQASGAPGNWTWTFYGLEVGHGGDVEYLIVGGGGGGGGGNSFAPGGGGAGGYRSSVEGELSGGNSPAEPRLTLLPGAYPVRVGAGGSGAPARGSMGQSGSDSQFASILSIGGGGGGGGGDGLAGGSGGGAEGGNSDSDYVVGSGTPGQGHDGGSGRDGANRGVRCGGGGGGAGGVGMDGESRTGGHGGVGLFSAITGIEQPFAGGGGGVGSEHGDAAIGLGGSGIGGDGSLIRDEDSVATSGVENTGSGGGAGNRDHPAGDGGAGIVVVRYPYFAGTIILIQ